MGDWYEYMFYTPGNFSPCFNVIHTHSPLGYARLRDSTNWTLVTHSQVNVYVSTSAAPTVQCLGIFEQANFSANGRQAVLAFQPGQPPSNFQFLFHPIAFFFQLF